MARDVLADIDRKLAALGMPRRSSRRSRSATLPPLSARQMQEAEESLMSKGLNWLGYVGESLSKGGAAVRGVASGLTGGEWGGGLLNLIPFSDTMGLTSEKDKIYGDDLLSHFGIEPAKKQKGLHPIDNPGDFAWDIASFGLDVVTDPLTYFGGFGILAKGAGVAGKAGRAFRAAGLLDDAARVAAKTGAKGSAGVGRRVFNMTQTPRTAIKLLPKAEQAAARQKFFTAATKGGTLKRSGARRVTDEAAQAMLDQPLGGLQRWNVPFTGLEYLPSGPIAQKIGGVLDKAGEAARYGRFSPAKGIARVFDQSVQGAKTTFIQKEAPFHGLAREAAEFEATSEVDNLLRPLLDTKGFDTDQGSDLLYDLFESVNPEEVNTAVRAITTDPTLGKTATEAMLHEAYSRYHRMIDTNYDAASAYGAAPAKHTGATLYAKRAMSNRLLRGGGDSLDDISRKVQPRRFGSQAPEKTYRKEFAHDLRTSLVKRLARDPEIESMLSKGVAKKEIAKTIGERYPEISKTYLTRKQNEAIAKLVSKQEGATEQVAKSLQSEIDTITGNAPNRHRALARWLGKHTPEQRKAGIFDVHIFNNILSSARHIKQSAASGEFLTKVLSAEDVLRLGVKEIDRGKDVPLSKVLQRLGLKQEGALPQIARSIGVTDLKALKNAVVRQDVAKDLLLKRSKAELPGMAGEALETFRSLTNLWKAGVTGPVYRPAFHVRNRMSGRVRNFLDRMASPRMNRVSHKILTGQVDETGVLRSHVLIKDMARSRGIDPKTLTNAQATDLAREVTRQADLLSRGQGDFVADAAGGLVEDAASGEAYFRDFPGGFLGRGEPEGILKGLATGSPLPRSVKNLFGMADEGSTWNPLTARVRGVKRGGLVGDVSQETTFAPIKGGEQIGRKVEGMNRLEPFLKLTGEGTDPLVAKRLVDAAQIAYANKNYTEAEQLLSVVFPFYKFAKGTAVHTAKELLDRPGGGLAQLIRAGEKFRGEGIMPEYVAQGMAIPIPEGTPGIGPQPGGDPRYLSGLGLMHEDAFSFLGGGGRDTIAELMSRMNPLLKAPIEMATGKSFFMRGPGGPRDIDDLDPQLGRIYANVKGLQKSPRTNQVLEQLLANSPVAPLLHATRKLTGLLPRAGRTGSASFRAGKEAMNLLTGARLTDVPQWKQDAIIRKLVDEAMRVEGAKKFVRRYVSAEDRKRMTPQQRREVEKLMAISRVLDRRRKGR